MERVFYIKDDTGTDHIITTDAVARVTPWAQGIDIFMKTGERFRTTTFDLGGYAGVILGDRFIEMLMHEEEVAAA